MIDNVEFLFSELFLFERELNMMLKEDERNVFVVILKCYDKIKCDIFYIIC